MGKTRLPTVSSRVIWFSAIVASVFLIAAGMREKCRPKPEFEIVNGELRCSTDVERWLETIVEK
jgi:hypothetical protein